MTATDEEKKAGDDGDNTDESIAKNISLNFTHSREQWSINYIKKIIENQSVE